MHKYISITFPEITITLRTFVSASIVEISCACKLFLTVFFLVILLHRRQGYPISRNLACRILQTFNRFSDILPRRSTENREDHVAVVTGEHEEHPEEYHETHSAGVHSHADWRPCNVTSAPIDDPRFTAASTDSRTGSEEHAARLDLLFEL